MTINLNPINFKLKRGQIYQIPIRLSSYYITLTCKLRVSLCIRHHTAILK